VMGHSIGLRCLPSTNSQRAYPYDPASQVTQILHQLTATSTSINQAAYAYNPVGNRTSLTDRRGNQAFGYDPLDRLTVPSACPLEDLGSSRHQFPHPASR